MALAEKEIDIVQVLANTIRALDPQVRDAVLIGSAVYAPDLAQDYDVVVTSNSPRENREELFGSLLDAFGKVSKENVDLILRFPGDHIGNLALAILAGRVILGNSETIVEARRFFEEGGGAMNSFSQAESAIRTAGSFLKMAEIEKDPGQQDRCYRATYNELFDASRIAALVYLGREDTRWGGVAQELPWPLGGRFREMINTLHLFYSYEGNYPKDQATARQEFENWKDRVEEFVSEMRKRTLERGEETREQEGPTR